MFDPKSSGKIEDYEFVGLSQERFVVGPGLWGLGLKHQPGPECLGLFFLGLVRVVGPGYFGL